MGKYKIYEIRNGKKKFIVNTKAIVINLLNKIISNLISEIRNKENKHKIEKMIGEVENIDLKRFLMYLNEFFFEYGSSILINEQVLIRLFIKLIEDFGESKIGVTYFCFFIDDLIKKLEEDNGEEKEKELQFNQYLEEIIKNKQNGKEDELKVIEIDFPFSKRSKSFYKVFFSAFKTEILKQNRVEKIISEVIENIY